MTTYRNGAAPAAPVASEVETASVVAVTAELEDRRLRVVTKVRDEHGRHVVARIPDRELAALLPRSILVANGHPKPELLATIAAILNRTVLGRRVRVWETRGQRYLAFLSWRGVRFSEPRPSSRVPPAS
jgi:hypothetical protein